MSTSLSKSDWQSCPIARDAIASELEDISELGATGTIIISCQPIYQSMIDNYT